MAAALAGVVGPGVGFVSAAESSAADELAELRRLAAEAGIDLELPAWEFGGGIEFGVGYGDNVLLSPVAPESSGFARTTVDALAARLPDSGFEWFNYLDATYTRFFSAATDDALLALARSEVRWRPRAGLRFSLAGQVLYQDEVIDVSTLESGPVPPAEATVSSFALEPAVRWNFARGWTGAVKLSASYDDYRPPLDDYLELEPEFLLERSLGRWGTIAVVGASLTRDYEERPRAAAGGRPEIENPTTLEVAQYRGELRYEIGGGEAGGGVAWRAKLKASHLDNDDNGSGWYDYVRRVVHASVSLDSGAWHFESDTGWRRYDYRLQTVGFGIDPPKREREEWSWFARCERELREELAAFIEFEYERSRTNDGFLDYDNTTGIVGLRWSR